MDCIKQYANFSYAPGVKYCKATFDTYLCWPPTPAGQTSNLSCPNTRLSDTTRHAFRRCGDNGFWLGRQQNGIDHNKGWTNYTPCLPTEMQKLISQVNDDDSAQTKLDIAQWTRYMETTGFSISLVALLMSLFIFTYFKSLRNNRTNIHRNLFAAMTIQVIIRLIVYIDQAIILNASNMEVKGIADMPYICEVAYILLEYAISAMFTWIFIEGLFLHHLVTSNSFRSRASNIVFLIAGWGLPILFTALWASFTALHYQNDQRNGCWYGYNFLQQYWLLQGPRLSIIMVNLMFLLNIMRVLIIKLNATENSEAAKVKKAAKAALVLLPLLGITNILNMVEPVTGAVWKFALWCFVTHFLRSFQGFFLALIYCFMNGEVNDVIRRRYRYWQAEREDTRFRTQENESQGATSFNRMEMEWIQIGRTRRFWNLIKSPFTRTQLPDIELTLRPSQEGIILQDIRVQETVHNDSRPSSLHAYDHLIFDDETERKALIFPKVSKLYRQKPKNLYINRDLNDDQLRQLLIGIELQCINELKAITCVGSVQDTANASTSSDVTINMRRMEISQEFIFIMEPLLKYYYENDLENCSSEDKSRMTLWMHHLQRRMLIEFCKCTTRMRQLPDDEEHRTKVLNNVPYKLEVYTLN